MQVHRLEMRLAFLSLPSLFYYASRFYVWSLLFDSFLPIPSWFPACFSLCVPVAFWFELVFLSLFSFPTDGAHSCTVGKTIKCLHMVGPALVWLKQHRNRTMEKGIEKDKKKVEFFKKNLLSGQILVQPFFDSLSKIWSSLKPQSDSGARSDSFIKNNSYWDNLPICNSNKSKKQTQKIEQMFNCSGLER